MLRESGAELLLVPPMLLLGPDEHLYEGNDGEAAAEPGLCEQGEEDPRERFPHVVGRGHQAEAEAVRDFSLFLVVSPDGAEFVMAEEVHELAKLTLAISMVLLRGRLGGRLSCGG